MSGRKNVRPSKKSLSLPPKKLSPSLNRIGDISDSLGIRAYLVGGAVRDLLLGRKTLDWDIVTEESPARLVKKFAALKKGKVLSHERFGTFVLTLPGNKHIDFVTARKESYPRPGILPVVSFSNIKDDLYRRDFTLNALAVILNRVGRGDIVDHFGGYRDLRERKLRVLHAKSFRDDPTRIFRLARFAGRGFSVDSATEKLVLRDRGFLGTLSPERVREELLAILSEDRPSASLRILAKWKVLERVFPDMPFENVMTSVDRPRKVSRRLQVILSSVSPENRKAFIESLRLPRSLKRELQALNAVKKPRAVLTGNDLIRMGYTPGPLFKTILDKLAAKGLTSRSRAETYVFDNFPRIK